MMSLKYSDTFVFHIVMESVLSLSDGHYFSGVFIALNKLNPFMEML